MNNELWLEFGYIKHDGWYDLIWYNEGRWQELPYFLKHLLKDLLKKDRYYFLRYRGKTLNIKGKGKQ